MSWGLDAFKPFDGFVEHGEAKQGRHEEQQGFKHELCWLID